MMIFISHMSRCSNGDITIVENPPPEVLEDINRTDIGVFYHRNVVSKG